MIIYAIQFLCIIIIAIASDQWVNMINNPKLPKHLLQVYGNKSLGYYYVNLYVGNPPQQQSVIIDTGSGNLAFPCSKCKQPSCGSQHINPFFDLTKSKTSKLITCSSNSSICQRSCSSKNNQQSCTFQIQYAEGSSLNGIIVQDSIQLQKDSAGEGVKVMFGCTIKQTNYFYTQEANGIFGLSPNRVSKLLDTLIMKHNGFTNQTLQFSLCLAKNGGLMAVGQTQKSTHLSQNSVKLKFNDDINLYSLEGIGKIKIDEVVLHDNENLGFLGIFIDSGATLTSFPSNVFNKFIKTLEDICALNYKNCILAKGISSHCFKIIPKINHTIQSTIVSIFPSINIQMAGIIVPWQSQNYFYLRDKTNGEVCLGITERLAYTLGGNWLVDRDVIFNLKEQIIEIYPKAKCSSDDSQELAAYHQIIDGNKPLQYISLQPKVHEQLFFKVVLVILIGIIILLSLGHKCCRRSFKFIFGSCLANQMIEEEVAIEIKKFQDMPITDNQIKLKRDQMGKQNQKRQQPSK